MSIARTLTNPHEAIRNTIALYCIALDTKQFDLLEQGVFTTDVEAVYPFDGKVIRGVAALAKRIEERLKPVTTQHALTTQHIQVTAVKQIPVSASATTYFTGVHFGQGRWQGKQVIAYGKYVDDLVDIGAGGNDDDINQWRITRRQVTFFSRVGEEGVMDGEEGAAA